MESEIYVKATPREMKRVMDTGYPNVRYFESKSVVRHPELKINDFNFVNGQDTKLVYEAIVRHPEYLSYLHNGRVYASWDAVLRAMKRREKEMMLPKGMQSRKLAEHLAKFVKRDSRAKGCTVKVMGPFGLRAESHISVKIGEKVWLLTLTVDDYRDIYLYDTEETLNTYAPGTLGAINGMNNVSKPLPDSIPAVLDILFAK